MTHPEWAQVVAWLVERYPHMDWSAHTNSAYFSDLARFNVTHVWAGVHGYYRSGHAYPPTGSDLLSRAEDAARANPIAAGVLPGPCPHRWAELPDSRASSGFPERICVHCKVEEYLHDGAWQPPDALVEKASG